MGHPSRGVREGVRGIMGQDSNPKGEREPQPATDGQGPAPRISQTGTTRFRQRMAKNRGKSPSHDPNSRGEGKTHRGATRPAVNGRRDRKRFDEIPKIGCHAPDREANRIQAAAAEERQDECDMADGERHSRLEHDRMKAPRMVREIPVSMDCEQSGNGAGKSFIPSGLRRTCARLPCGFSQGSPAVESLEPSRGTRIFPACSHA